MKTVSVGLAAALALTIYGPVQVDAAPQAAVPAGKQEEGRSPLNWDGQGWDVSAVRGVPRPISFVATEGTWTSVDLTADGKTLLFDFLGQLYAMPASGGEASPLTANAGSALSIHPRLSPDGKSVAFISDRSGQNALWVMAPDGSNVRPVFADKYSRITQPSWAADGKSIVAVRHFPSMRGMHRRVASIWSFPLDGGEPKQLVSSAEANYYDPLLSKDQRYLYFTAAYLIANNFGTESAHRIQRLDMKTGEIKDFIANQPAVTDVLHPSAENQKRGYGVLALSLSPDGRYLAYAKQNADRTWTYRGHEFSPVTELWVHDIKTGKSRMAVDRILTDLSTAHAMYSQRRLPGIAWSADARQIIVSIDGQPWRVDLATGGKSAIPFKVKVDRVLSEQARGHVKIADAQFDASFLQWPASSADGRSLAFIAAGHLWLRDVASGKIRQLTSSKSRDFYHTPIWSPDGSTIAYTSWNDETGGALWLIAIKDGAARKLTRERGFYLSPTWSPDGSRIAVARGRAETPELGWESVSSWDVVELDARETGAEKRLITVGSLPAPYYASDGALHVQAYDPKTDQDRRLRIPREIGRFDTTESLLRIAPGSDKPEELLKITRILEENGGTLTEAQISPDGKWIAVQAAQNVLVARIPAKSGNGSLRLDINDHDSLFRRVGNLGGVYHKWRADGLLEFFSGNLYITYDPTNGAMTSTALKVAIDRPIPKGSVAFRNAKIITVDDQGVIEKGDLVIRNNRIACVGTCSLDGVEKIIDATGKTIMPGLIDVHAHYTEPRHGVIPQNWPGSSLYLAYGVTTAFDPSTRSTSAFPLAQLTEAGRIVGTRVYSSGEIVRGWGDHVEIETLDDARDIVGRLKRWGAISIKNYRLNRRDQSQMVNQAARELGISMTAEGADLPFNVSLALDGQTGWEHPLQYLPIYSDASTFFGLANIVYSPTVSVAGHPYGTFHYFRAGHDLRKDPKFRRFAPASMAESRMEGIVPHPAHEFSFPIIAEGLADIIRAGGYGAIGDHGENFGLGSQWEMWSYATAMPAAQAIRVATRDGAYFLGLEDETGTLKAGKVADLIVLNADPLENIRNSLDIQYVVKDGIVYDDETLDPVWPTERKP